MLFIWMSNPLGKRWNRMKKPRLSYVSYMEVAVTTWEFKATLAGLERRWHRQI